MQMFWDMLTLKRHPMLMDKVNFIYSPWRKPYWACNVTKSNNRKLHIKDSCLTQRWLQLYFLLEESNWNAYRAFHQVVLYQSRLSFHLLKPQEDKIAQEPEIQKQSSSIIISKESSATSNPETMVAIYQMWKSENA